MPLRAQVPVLALLPPWLVPRIRAPAVGMGNRQWLAFTRDGFRKNLYPLLGGRSAPFVVGVALFSLAAVYPWVTAGRGTSAALVALALWISAASRLGSRRGAVEWNGRVLPTVAGEKIGR